MAKAKDEAQLSLWEALPAEQREVIKRSLLKANESPPKQQPRNKSGQFSLRGYVRCELSAADKDAFREWEADKYEPSHFGRLVALADSGYLVKLGEAASGHQASLCAASTDQPWDGYVLTAHAISAARATLLLIFKHEVLMRGDWSAWMTDDSEDSFR